MTVACAISGAERDRCGPMRLSQCALLPSGYLDRKATPQALTLRGAASMPRAPDQALAMQGFSGEKFRTGFTHGG
jgi:hypothetical protein